MNSDLTPENERFVADQLAAGEFASRDAVIDAAVSLMRLRRSILEKIEMGRQQLDEGDAIDLDDASLSVLFNGLKSRATNNDS